MCQKVYRMYNSFQKKMGKFGVVGERNGGKNLILNENVNIYYLKTKLGHTEQIWINVILDCLEKVLG